MKAFTIVPIFHAKLVLSVSHDIRAARAEHNDEFGPCLLQTVPKALASHSDDLRSFAMFFKQDGIDHGVIAHEVFHITHHILQGVESQFDVNNHEQYAYLCEWITDWVYEQLKKHEVSVHTSTII